MQRITTAWLQQHDACRDQVEQFAELYPDGAEVSLETALACHRAGLDVIWAAVRLMTQAQRKAFILFTLHQRQPHLVTLFRRAGLDAQATAIAALDWTNLATARTVLEDAGDAGDAEDAGAAGAAGAARAAAWAAWDAAGAARAAAGAARDAARAAARAAWDAAGAAARAAWDAAGAARDAAWDAQVREAVRILHGVSA